MENIKHEALCLVSSRYAHVSCSFLEKEQIDRKEEIVFLWDKGVVFFCVTCLSEMPLCLSLVKFVQHNLSQAAFDVVVKNFIAQTLPC